MANWELDVLPKDTESLLPTSKKSSVLNRRHRIHRRPRSMLQAFICGSIGITMISLLLYIPLFTNYNSRIYPLSSWSYNTSRNTSDYVLPNRDTVLVHPKNVCDTSSKFFLLIMVSSALTNFDSRQNIRDTWGNTSEFNYPVFWKLHKKLKGKFLDLREQEIEKYKMFLNMTDETSKTVLSKDDDGNNTLRNHNIPVKVVFLIGRRIYDPYLGNETQTRLDNEIKDYGDILQEDFLDTYNNLTIKSVMMLKWIADTRCHENFKFLVKCDDDSFINIPNLLHYLLGGTLPLYNSTVSMYDEKSYKVLNDRNRLTQSSKLLLGFKFCNSKPIASITNKWYMPYYMYPNDTYPNYLSGGSYLMSSDIVPELYTSALNSSLIYLEDIFITGISAEHAGIRRHHNPLFLFFNAKNKCVLRGVITEHYIKGDRMRDAYHFLVNLANHCTSVEGKILAKNLRNSRSVCH